MKTVRIKVYKTKRVIKTKQGNKIEPYYVYRNPNASSVNYTKEDMESFDKIEFTFLDKTKQTDRDFILNKWRHKL